MYKRQVLGTASNAYSLFKNFGDSLRDTTRIAYTLAESLEGLKYFYACYIILQGLGLYPLRLAQVASMALYPVTRIGAKTPRGKIREPIVVTSIVNHVQITPNLSSLQLSAMASTCLRPY